MLTVSVDSNVLESTKVWMARHAGAERPFSSPLFTHCDHTVRTHHHDKKTRKSRETVKGKKKQQQHFCTNDTTSVAVIFFFSPFLSHIPLEICIIMSNNFIDLYFDSEEEEEEEESDSSEPIANKKVDVSVETRASEVSAMNKDEEDRPDVESSESEGEVEVVENCK